jgi:hypothetical protein
VRRPLVLGLVGLVAALAPRTAAAAPGEGVAEPPVALALAAGAATTLLPLTLGVMHTANAVTYPSRNTGLLVAGAGFVLAPVVAHVIVGEYARAAAFGAIPAAAEIAMIALVSVNPDAVFAGTTGTRTTFALLFSAGAFNAAVSLIDVALAGDRARARLPAPLRHVTVAPLGARGGAGLLLGGIL